MNKSVRYNIPIVISPPPKQNTKNENTQNFIDLFKVIVEQNIFVIKHKQKYLNMKDTFFLPD